MIDVISIFFDICYWILRFKISPPIADHVEFIYRIHLLYDDRMWIEVVYTKECTTRVRLQRGRDAKRLYVCVTWK